MATADLTIEYDGGHIKHINDYGFSGLLSLNKIYSIINEWEEELEWEKISNTSPLSGY